MKQILGQGYRKGPAFSRNATSNASIGGLSAVFPNQYVELVKTSPWPDILKLLGRGGDLLMIDMLVDCALFRRADCGRGNYYQISGRSCVRGLQSDILILLQVWRLAT